ncbi:MAG: hypothetical protein NT116_04795 [Candidatus Parcubacteria bacterium]|nr:hypothetical protein [Candidatus Parcubacteria bacterium]
MARVTGPLYSMSASGKLGDAMVYFGWKGLNVVRQWVKPANPMKAAQGDQRIMLGGTGRSVGEVKPEKVFAQQLINLNLIPGGQTKQSFLVKYILDHFLTNATTYAAQLALLTAHTSYTAFQTAADNLGIVEFDLDYATVAAYNKALGLYLIAKSAIALGFTGTPYTTNITAWVTADVNGMVNDFTSAT